MKGPFGEPSAKELEFLQAALEGDLHTVIRLCEEKEININTRGPQNGMTALYHAASHGHNAMLDYLLVQDGIDVNIPNALGQTPLMRAVWFEQEKAVEKLLDHAEIDVAATDHEGLSSAFSWADFIGNPHISKILSEKTGMPLNEEKRFISKMENWWNG
ncbi:MAG: ankyrin repeat domain-containing protein [Alphaproteobacteria bacterium]|nr:MAG: ankyrin repeat domain-containing protein [Alphaproteobacteria bacterium]